MQLSLIVCCCFPIGNRLQRKVVTCWYCFSISVNEMLLLLVQSNKASWCYICQSPLRQFTKLTQFTKYDVLKSPLKQFTKFTQFKKCEVPKSPVIRQSSISNLQSSISNLQSPVVCRSLIPTVTLQVHYSLNLHCCIATVAPSCSESPFFNYYSVRLCSPTLSVRVIMLPINDLATDVNTLAKYLSSS